MFQVLAALNFATHFLAWSQRGVRAYFRDAEAKAIFGVLAASCVGIAHIPVREGHLPGFPDGAAPRHFQRRLHRHRFGGLHTQDYSHWPIFAPMWMMFLSCIVASSGSTGGGIKMIRTLVLAKQANRELESAGASELGAPAQGGRDRDRQSRGVRRARLRVPVFHEHRHAGVRPARAAAWIS